MDNLDKIFKAYDIRGVYPEEINEEIAYKIGRASARFLISKTQDKSFRLRSQKLEHMVVARDNRLSSEDLAKVLIEGIRDEGIDVIDIGIATTPMFYFSAIRYKAAGGAMITASHNPSEYNGFKIIRDKAMPVSESSGLNKIKDLLKKGKFQDSSNRGQLEKREALKHYIDNVFDFVYVENIKPFKVIIDTGKGIADLVVSELSNRIPGEFIHISSDFLNPQDAKEIQKKVCSEKADLGVAFDGDGDRILFIDEKGQRCAAVLIAGFLNKNFFHNKDKILYTNVSSRVVKEEIEETGNIPIVSKVGHTFVKEKMSKQGAVFGCEPSGHYYFKANHFIESPFIVLLKVLEILSKTKMPLSELVKQFQNYYREEINIKKTTGSRIKEKTREFPDWWYNIRSSNTEPVVRLTIEARTKELLEQKKKELIKLTPFSF